jgi:DNA polymerase I
VQAVVGCGTTTPVETEGAFEYAIEACRKHDILAVDTETVGLLSLDQWAEADRLTDILLRETTRQNAWEAQWDPMYKSKRKGTYSQWVRALECDPCESEQGAASLKKAHLLSRLYDRYPIPVNPATHKPDKKFMPKDARINRSILDQVFLRGKTSPKGYTSYKKQRQNRLKSIQRRIDALNHQAVTNETGLHHYANQLGCVQLGCPDGSTYLVRPDVIDTEALTDLLNSRRVIIGANFKFDYKQLKHHLGLSLHLENLWDVQGAEYVLYNGIASIAVGGKSLAKIAKRRLDFDMDKSCRVSNWVDYWTPELVTYASEDVQVLFPIYEQQLEEVKDSGLESITRLEMNIAKVVGDMELKGVGVDVPYIFALRDKYQQVVIENKREVENHYGIKNANSNPQLLKALQACGMDLRDVQAKTLEYHKDDPTIQILLEYRSAQKRASTYTENLLEHVVVHEFKDEEGILYENVNIRFQEFDLSADHIIHARLYASFNPWITETGRFSSSAPNLQNIPATKEFRRIFVPRAGHVFIDIDLSSVEPRIIAHLAQEESLIEAFKAGRDVYLAMGELFYGVPYADLAHRYATGDTQTKDLRKKLKVLLLATIYGQQAFSLARDLSVDMWEAQDMLRTFRAVFPKITQWSDWRREESLRSKQTETLGGRRRLFDIPDEPDNRTKAYYARRAVNTAVQGTGGDGLKLTMWMGCLYFPSTWGLLIQIHDELLYEVPLDDVIPAIDAIETIMRKGTQHFIPTVPVEADAEVGLDWGAFK